MRPLLYIMLFVVVLTAEAITGYLIKLLLMHTHPHAFYIGVGFIVGFVIANCELVHRAIKEIKT